MNRRQWLTALGLAPLLGATRAVAATPQRQWAQVDPREKIRQRHFPDVELSNQRGERVSFYRDLVRDKLVVMNFMYATCEGICPLVMHNLAKVHKLFGERMGRDVFMISMTLKPEEDTVEVLGKYAEMHDIGAGWSLITGTPADLETLRQYLGFTDPDPELDRDKPNHIGNLRYGNEPLMRWGACPGMSDPEWIHESILWVDWPREASKGDLT